MKNSHGFTLIETLVSLVIISIGILGFALLQVESLKAAKTASERSKAIQFADDIIDRIRSNNVMLDSSGNVNILVYNKPDLDAAGAKPGTVCADETTTSTTPIACSLTDLANYDIWQWRSNIANNKLGLGTDGKGSVAVTNTVPSTVTVKIQWKDKDEEKNYTLSTQLY